MLRDGPETEYTICDKCCQVFGVAIIISIHYQNIQLTDSAKTTISAYIVLVTMIVLHLLLFNV